jgi:sugar transferase (PEP-CTERM/EpsH1 system associated)
MSRPVRILHVVDTLETGGLEQGVVNLIRNMNASRFEHMVCAIRNLGPLTDQLPKDRCEVSLLGKRANRYSLQGALLARHIRETQPDVVHSRNWGTIEAVPAAWVTRCCAIVHSEHGIEHAGGEEPLRRRCFRRMAYEMADAVFCVSSQLKSRYAKQTGFADDRIRVIRNGVDLRRFQFPESPRASVRRDLGIADHEFCLGFVGRLEPVKGLGTVLTALEQACEFPADWRLVVAGDGVLNEPLRRRVNDSGRLRGRVTFLGDVRNVPELLTAFDVYVLPSLSEGISNSLLEAMASGVPCIATAVGGNPEVVVDGESGMLFPAEAADCLADRLAVLYRRPELRQKLRRQAMEHVRQYFSLESMVARYEDLYETVALRRPSRQHMRALKHGAEQELPTGIGQGK